MHHNSIYPMSHNSCVIPINIPLYSSQLAFVDYIWLEFPFSFFSLTLIWWSYFIVFLGKSIPIIYLLGGGDKFWKTKSKWKTIHLHTIICISYSSIKYFPNPFTYTHNFKIALSIPYLKRPKINISLHYNILFDMFSWENLISTM